MPHEVPSELATLLNASDDTDRDRAWARFVARYTPLILHVARKHGASQDEAMDRYAFILERLRTDDYRRLRQWVQERRSKLTTWLVVVAERLCHDEHRARYGRVRANGDAPNEERAMRRRLADLIVDDVSVEQVIDDTTIAATAEDSLRHGELLWLLGQSLDNLPPADQLLLALRYRDGLSAQEIARITHATSPFQIYRRMQRVLDELRDALRARGVHDPVP